MLDQGRRLITLEILLKHTSIDGNSRYSCFSRGPPTKDTKTQMDDWAARADVDATRLSALVLTTQLTTFDQRVREKLAKLEEKIKKCERATTYIEVTRSLQQEQHQQQRT